MASTEFDIGVGTTTASTVANSLLSSPLTTEGTSCLKVIESTNSFVVWYRAALKSSVTSGRYVGVPSTKTISLRARLRRTAHTAGVPAQFAVGLYCKGIAADLASVAPLKDGSDQCYAVWLGDFDADGQAAPATHGVRFGKRKVGGILTGDTLVQSHAVDSWIGVRLDVSASGADDAIAVYVDVTGGETWGTAVHTATIVAADARKLPWGGTDQLGFFMCGAMNNSLPRGTANANISTYIETFRAVVE